jgi:hypothetical protein
MRSEDQTEEWLSILVGRLRQDDRVRLRRLLAEVEAPESYWLAAQDWLTAAAERRRALAAAVADALRSSYSDLPRTAAAKMPALDWERYLTGDDRPPEKDLAALPRGRGASGSSVVGVKFACCLAKPFRHAALGGGAVARRPRRARGFSAQRGLRFSYDQGRRIWAFWTEGGADRGSRAAGRRGGRGRPGAGHDRAGVRQAQRASPCRRLRRRNRPARASRPGS